MVAHGTIAFDTLTTSDQVNTGTEKSIDTSYLFNGSAKSWANYVTAATFVLNDSFNYASLTDSGAGLATHTVTNAFNNTYYSYVGMSNEVTSGASLTSKTTTTCRQYSYNSSSAAADTTENSFLAHGDLA